MELYTNRGAVPKKRELMMERQISTSPYVEVSPAEEPCHYKRMEPYYCRRLLCYKGFSNKRCHFEEPPIWKAVIFDAVMKPIIGKLFISKSGGNNSEHSSRRSLHDEVLRSALSIKNSLTVPVSSVGRRHSCNDADGIFDRAPFAPSPSRRNSTVKRTPSVVSTRGRRGSKYHCGVERRASHLSGSKKADYALVVKEGLTEEYRKEMRRRRIVWLVIGMFFFILTVSVLIVVITLTHRMDDGRRFGRYNCSC